MCESAIAIVEYDLDGVKRKTMPCKRWSCRDCMPFRLREIRKLALAGKPERFITLTVNPARYHDPAEAARDLKRAWDSLKKAIQRELGVTDMQYLVVIERTKKGWPHFHILQRGGYIPQDWLSKKMKKLAGAPIVDVRKVKDQEQAAAYVAKYISKAPAAFPGCKRYWRSRGWVVIPRILERNTDVDDRVYFITNIHWEDYHRALLVRGITEEEVEPGVFIWKHRNQGIDWYRLFVAVAEEAGLYKAPTVESLNDLPTLDTHPPPQNTAAA